jgi:hypothetical protein
MKKWILIIFSVILTGIIGIGFKLMYDLNEITKAFHSEHTLNKPSLNMLTESISPDQKYKYYEYQFDNGALGYSRVFWSVRLDDDKSNDLKKGIIPNGYKITGWSEDSKLILQKWKPYYESKTVYELEGTTVFNNIPIKVTE